jgi:nucleoside permease NupC
MNVLDAAALGAGSGLKLALNVGAMLLAFIGVIALLNLMLGGMAPSRRGEIARLGLLAVMAGSFSNLMSAAIAGLFWVG